MKKVIGHVSEEEKQEIQTLFERKNGLAELAKILPTDNAALYEKMVKDMGATSCRFEKWWSDTSKKYRWESNPGSQWEIDFQTNEILLIDKHL